MNRRVAVLLSLVVVAACAQPEAEPDSTDSSVMRWVPPGKTDDYFSTAGREYTVTGASTLVLAEDDAALGDEEATRARLLQAAGLKNFAIAWFLNQYVIDKHDAPNENYGGFTAMTRPASYETLAIEPVDGAERTWRYTFTSELSGPRDLLSAMPTEACPDDASKRCFDLEIPVLTADQMSADEWYRRSPWGSWNPETYSGAKEKLALRIEPYPESNDAYLEYGKLFAGNRVTVGIFVGWDYYEARYDLQDGRALYDWLLAQGFTAPVESFDALGLTSGSFTKKIRAFERELEVDVVLYHPGMGDPTDPVFSRRARDMMFDALQTRQIVVYEGHAGPLYGFSLTDWNATSEGDLDDSLLGGLQIPAGLYQIVLAAGCDTYMVADALYALDVKAGRKDLDVITTSTFGSALAGGRTTMALLGAVVNTNGPGGSVEAQKYGEILRAMNATSWTAPIFGVHGIDDNPRSNPLVAPSVHCKVCHEQADCGTGALCIGGIPGTEDGSGRCTVDCRTDADCRSGEVCYEVADGTTIVGHQCIPMQGCEQ